MTTFYNDRFCPVCGKNVKKYISTCGNKECTKQLQQTTNIKKYGKPCSVNADGPKLKMLNTLKEKYGVENVSQIPEVKEKKQQTCLDNFGVPWPMQSEEIRGKSKDSVKEKYGVENVSKSLEIINKIKESKNRIEENGKKLKENSFEKSKNVIFKKYGDYYFTTEEFKEKYRKIMLEKYGVDNFWKSEKFREMMIERGVHRNPNELDDIQMYFSRVKSLTEKIFRKYFDIISLDFKRGNEYHLDHKFSIIEGYRNSIIPEIIASVVNLEMLPAKENMRKNDKCSITKEQLFELYEILIEGNMYE